MNSELKKEKTIGLKLILGWIIGVLFLFLGVLNLFKYPAVGIFEIMAALIIFPPFMQFIKAKFGLSLSGILRFVIFVILMGIGVGWSLSMDKTESSQIAQISTSSDKTTEVTYKTGDVIKTDEFEIIITSIEERSGVGSRYFEKKPSQGGTFVAVQYQYKNITNKPIGSFSTPNIKLVDKNGTEYSVDTGASSNFATELELDRKILSDLNPGITVSDAAIFEINKEQYANQGWSLLVKADKDIKVSVK